MNRMFLWVGLTFGAMFVANGLLLWFALSSPRQVVVTYEDQPR